ncbi:extracellular solute-binding protein [Nonomuraea sp. NBC_01738]|uniref:ABC transporter substrate-binding protein n=1 Tax=Nonomuraea sp. NBC_01738 TaxID=2976003 RepID=UPI002E1181A5|nr:extracellular solute-binding protein [Nonomuraea sp. NBC_01738]
MSIPLSRRGFLAGVAGVGGVAALGACSSGGGGAKPTGGGSAKAVDIVHWDQFVSQEPWVKKEIELFQAAHPGVTIKRSQQASGDLEKLLDLAWRGNNPPDIFVVPSAKLDDYVEAGRLLPLDKYATLDYQKTFPAYSFVEGVNAIDGKIYGAPFAGEAPWVQLYINNKVFKDAGLVEADGTVKIPKTWDEVTLFAEQITKKANGSVYGLGFGNSAFAMIPWWAELFTAGAGVPGSMPPGFPRGIDPRTGKFTMHNNDAMVNFLTMFMEWKNKGFIIPNALSIDDEISRQHFARGKFGMIVGGVWNQPGWSELGFTEYTLTTLVAPQEQPQSFFYRGAGNYSLAVSATTKNPDDVWEWFKWWHGPEAGAHFVQELKGGLSSHPEVNDPSKIDFAPFAAYVAMEKLILPGPSPALRNPLTATVVPKKIVPDFDAVTTGLYTGQIKDMKSALDKLAEDEERVFVEALEKAKKKGVKVSLDDYIFADWDLTKPYKWDIPEYIGAK